MISQEVAQNIVNSLQDCGKTVNEFMALENIDQHYDLVMRAKAILGVQPALVEVGPAEMGFGIL